MFTTEQAAAGFCFLGKYTKPCFGVPKPCLLLNRQPQTFFSLETKCLLEKGKLSTVVMDIESIVDDNC